MCCIQPCTIATRVFQPAQRLPDLSGAKLIAPADALLRVLRVQVRDEVVVAHCAERTMCHLVCTNAERVTLYPAQP